MKNADQRDQAFLTVVTSDRNMDLEVCVRGVGLDSEDADPEEELRVRDAWVSAFEFLMFKENPNAVPSTTASMSSNSHHAFGGTGNSSRGLSGGSSRSVNGSGGPGGAAGASAGGAGAGTAKSPASGGTATPTAGVGAGSGAANEQKAA